MRDKQTAFARAAHALSQLGLPQELPHLKSHSVFIRREVLGGSHSVATYPPLDALAPCPAGEGPAIAFEYSVNLYVHIPFCDTICTFCHYAVERYRNERVARYMRALTREMELWGARLRASNTLVSSIYIGGGTPLTLSPSELNSLFASIRGAFRMLPAIEICVEGSPMTIMGKDGLEKLDILKRNNVRRVSFGVQSFEENVLHAGARGYAFSTAFLACRRIGEMFPNWNIDLIQSLYDGTPDEVWENLNVMSRIRPAHITWYHGRFANRPQGHWLHDPGKKSHFEKDEDTLLGRMLIWQELERMGYVQVDGNRFVTNDRFVDPFKKTRTSVHDDLLGLGVSSYSHARGLFFRNEANIDEYIRRMEAGLSPVTRSFSFTPGEYLAASYALGLRSVRIETDETRHLRKQEPSLSAHFDSMVQKLTAMGLLETVSRFGKEGLQLTSKGRLFEDEVLALFFSPAVQATLNKS